MGWKGAEPSEASLSRSVLVAELGWNKTSFSSAMEKEAEELLLLSGSGGRKTGPGRWGSLAGSQVCLRWGRAVDPSSSGGLPEVR